MYGVSTSTSQYKVPPQLLQIMQTMYGLFTAGTAVNNVGGMSLADVPPNPLPILHAYCAMFPGPQIRMRHGMVISPER